MLKFSKPGINKPRTMNFKMFKLVLGKAEEPEIKLPTSLESLKRKRVPEKKSTSALLTMPKPLTVWITGNSGKLFKISEYHTPYMPLEKSVCRSGSSNENWT